MSQVHYGGQAVIEGVMMRGARNMAIAVRKPSGDVLLHSEPLPAGKGSLCTSSSPEGLRTAMAMFRAPRIITPSMTAWPP